MQNWVMKNWAMQIPVGRDALHAAGLDRLPPQSRIVYDHLLALARDA